MIIKINVLIIVLSVKALCLLGQTNDIIIIPTKDSNGQFYGNDYRNKSDTVLLNKEYPPINSSFDENADLSIPPNDQFRIMDCVYKAFTEERYNFLAQKKQGFILVICQDPMGYIKEVNYSCSKYDTFLAAEDFSKIDRQLKSLKLSVPNFFINYSFIRSSHTFEFSERPYIYDLTYEAEKCNPASPNYNAILCQISKCDPRSPNYDPAFCVQAVCDPGSAGKATTVRRP